MLLHVYMPYTYIYIHIIRAYIYVYANTYIHIKFCKTLKFQHVLQFRPE